MTTHTFYPYPFIEDIALSVDAVEPGVSMDTNSRYLRLWESPADRWTLRLTVEIDPSVVHRVLPPDEHASPPLDVEVTFRSASSRTRIRHRLEFEPGTLAREIAFDRDDWAGLVEVGVHLVRTADGEHAGPWARPRHTVVGTGDPVRIDVDEPERVPGDSLTIVWEDFTDSGVQWLRQHSGDLFALVTSAAGDPPTLYLNQGFPSAVSVLSSTGRHGRRARARDAAFDTIVHQAWSSVLASSLCEWKDLTLNAEPTMDEALNSLPLWMAAVIRDWAPYLYADGDREEALHEVWDDVVGGQWEDLLTDRLPNAIQHRFGAGNGLAGLIREFDL